MTFERSENVYPADVSVACLEVCLVRYSETEISKFPIQHQTLHPNSNPFPYTLHKNLPKTPDPALNATCRKPKIQS